MKEILIEYNYIFIAVTFFLIISLVGYFKENKSSLKKYTTNTKESFAGELTSVFDLEEI